MWSGWAETTIRCVGSGTINECSKSSWALGEEGARGGAQGTNWREESCFGLMNAEGQGGRTSANNEQHQGRESKWVGKARCI